MVFQTPSLIPSILLPWLFAAYAVAYHAVGLWILWQFYRVLVRLADEISYLRHDLRNPPPPPPDSKPLQSN